MKLWDYMNEFSRALTEQLKEDDKRWGKTYQERPKEGQEQRIFDRLSSYWVDYKLKGIPIPWLKIAGLAMIAWLREEGKIKKRGWIGVDLDGTLAKRTDWTKGVGVGEPVPAMVQRVQDMLEDGWEVRILTARVAVTGEYSPISKHYADPMFADQQTKLIQDWCLKHIGQVLPVTAQKDFKMEALFDDRCIQVIPDEGILVGTYPLEEL